MNITFCEVATCGTIEGVLHFFKYKISAHLTSIPTDGKCLWGQRYRDIRSRLENVEMIAFREQVQAGREYHSIAVRLINRGRV